MQLGRVIGDVVVTRKDETLMGLTLLVVQPLTPERAPAGRTLVAADAVGAGVGETVLVVSGSSARMASGLKDCPIDAAIVGIVDEIEIKD